METTREQQLEQALSDVLAIIDGKESRGESIMASVHGYGCDPEVSERNGKTIEEAYALLGRERPGWNAVPTADSSSES